MKRALPFLMLWAAICACPSWAQSGFWEVVYLEDGTTCRGLILELTPGGEVRLDTLAGQQLVFPEVEVLRIEREPLPSGSPEVICTDVVLLKEGVIFRGLIVEQVPKVSMTLQADNGVRLVFTMDEIWKIGRDRQFSVQTPKEGEPAESRDVTALRLQLQLQIASGKLAGGEAEKPHREEGGEGAGDLEEEVEKLKEEIAGIEDEQQEESRAQADQKATDLQEVVGDLLSQVDQLLGQADLDEAARREIEDLKSQLQSMCSAYLSSSQEARAHSSLEACQQEQAALEARNDAGDISALVSGEAWRNGANSIEVAQLAGSLKTEELQALYDQSRRRANQIVWDTAKNLLLPGLAIGSWKQGDRLGGLLSTGACLAGLVLLGFGLDVQSDPGAQGLLVDNVAVTLNAAGYAALALWGGGYGLSLVRPTWYARQSNRRLHNLLLAPKVNP
jgi:hypothetical protein